MLRPEVLQFLAAHHWVASVEQLRALGVTRGALEHARRTARVVSPAHGVVVLAGAQLSLEGRALLAQVAAGREAFVSGPTAGALHGLRGMPTGVVEISVKQYRHLEPAPGSRLFRTSSYVEVRDVTTRDDGMRVATPLRTLFGLAAQFNQLRFERAAEDAWHKGLVDPAQAWAYLDDIRRSGRTGVRAMDRWLEKTAVRTRPAQSGLELDVIDLVARADLPEPQRQHPVQLSSGETIHLDVAWPAIRLAVEPGHSWWHGGDLGQRRDQARDRACVAVGWLVVRFDEDVRRDPDRAVRELRSIHRARSLELQAR
jgi:very-short-patch-repair endonuclease